MARLKKIKLSTNEDIISGSNHCNFNL